MGECFGCDCGAPHDCEDPCYWWCPACLAWLDQDAAQIHDDWLFEKILLASGYELPVGVDDEGRPL